MTRRITAVAAIVLGAAAVSPAQAQDVKLPPTIAFTAYDTGTSGFNIAVGVGKMMKDKYGSDVRVLPAGNDVARPRAAARRPRGAGLDGNGHLLRAGRRVRVRRQGMGSAGRCR